MFSFKSWSTTSSRCRKSSLTVNKQPINYYKETDCHLRKFFPDFLSVADIDTKRKYSTLESLNSKIDCFDYGTDSKNEPSQRAALLGRAKIKVFTSADDLFFR